MSFASKIAIPARMAWREWPAMARRRFSLRIEQPEAREMRVELVEHLRSAPASRVRLARSCRSTVYRSSHRAWAICSSEGWSA
jgi:NADPH-dependent ferric siderophore reductase